MSLIATTALALAFSAPALEPPPDVVRFAADQRQPVVQDGARITSECGGPSVASGGWNGDAYLHMGCGWPELRFDAPQAMVELFVRLPQGGTLNLATCRFDGESCVPIEQRRMSGANGWVPVVFGTSGIDRIRATETPRGGHGTLLPVEIDDVAFSRVRQPGTEVHGPQTVVEGRPAEFTLSSSAAPATFRCALDDTPFAPCATPYTSPALPRGEHHLRVIAVDAYGADDASSPARADFTVVPPSFVIPIEPTPTPTPSPTPTPTPTHAAPPTQSPSADADRDVLPDGNALPAPGRTSVVRVLAGEVYVKLPTPFKQTGFVPLKGVATLPLGTIVDTRKGEVAIQAAANSFPAADPRARRQEARIKAAMFVLKQRRLRARSRVLPTDVGLLSPPAAEAACATGPAKGIAVRTVSMTTTNGSFRVLGGASTTTARSATFNVTDRCDGTMTEVGRGSVRVSLKGHPKPITVRAGRAYLVKAKLFAVRKGQRPGQIASGSSGSTHISTSRPTL